jgi:hypothetical protein
MDHDDPQRRIAEPEAWNDSRKSAWGFTANLWNSLVMAFLVVSLGIAAVTYGALTPYGYWVGTPTKATVDHCELHGISSLESSPDLDCTGTWRVRGQSQNGSDQAVVPRQRAERDTPREVGAGRARA